MRPLALLLVALVVAAGVLLVPWRAPAASIPTPAPLAATLPPLPATIEPSRIARRDGTMTVSDVRGVGLLITALVTVTGDLVESEGDWRRTDTVAYHLHHYVAAGVDVARAELRVTRLPDGGQRAALALPAPRIYSVDPDNAQAGVVEQERRGPAVWAVPWPILALAPGVAAPAPALVNSVISDADARARAAACAAWLTVPGVGRVQGIHRAAGLVARAWWERTLREAQFEEVAVTVGEGGCA